MCSKGVARVARECCLDILLCMMQFRFGKWRPDALSVVESHHYGPSGGSSAFGAIVNAVVVVVVIVIAIIVVVIVIVIIVIVVV